MLKIIKIIPKFLQEWYDINKDLNQGYDDSFPKPQVRANLLKEQFYLCAYTMRELNLNNSHIEHFLPRCNHPDKEVDYLNLFACWPGDNRRDYGAKFKDDSDPTIIDIISPLDNSIHNDISYNENGHTIGITNKGINTIKVLNLNEITLVNDRKGCIEGFLMDENNLISIEDLKILVEVIMTPDSNGKLPQFCVAVKECAEIYTL